MAIGRRPLMPLRVGIGTATVAAPGAGSRGTTAAGVPEISPLLTAQAATCAREWKPSRI